MHPNRTRACAPADPDQLKQALLGLVVCDHQGLWSLAELDRFLTPAATRPWARSPTGRWSRTPSRTSTPPA
jgi:hypothetical protein